jgi:SAM-dependent methyltransferase
MQDRLFHDPELVQFYDAENGWGDDTRYCLRLAEGAASVLDLGCGTGLLAAALGGTREVWGVDPAAAMLDVAARRDGGQGVTWVEADARSVRLGRRFDLVLLTGHAFQCFLTDADQRAVCATIAAHLAPEGRFIFDSRNPAREEWREWVPERSERVFDLEPHGHVTGWNDVRFDAARDVVTYDTIFRASSGMQWMASSSIRFASKVIIQHAISDAGLRVDRWLGDWHGSAWTAAAGEIIPVGRLA